LSIGIVIEVARDMLFWYYRQWRQIMSWKGSIFQFDISISVY